MRFGLSEEVMKKLQQVFESEPKVQKAIIFGSRAKGNYREGSDIDIAIKGQHISFHDVLNMTGKFEELNLPYEIDLVHYETIKEPALTAHIDRVGIEFYSRWKEVKLEEVAEIKYGKAHQALGDGKIPAYGSGGIMRYVDKAIYSDESILIPRKGTLNNIFYRNEPFWTVDTMFWTKLNKEKVVPKFLFYQLSTFDFAHMNVGSAVPSMTVPVLNELDISLPPLPEQQAIAEILSSIDDKIDLLHRQNKTLEQLAETLFRQWFVEEAEESWEVEKLGDVAVVQNGYAFSSQDYVPFQEGHLEVLKMGHIEKGGGLRINPKKDFVPREDKLKKWVLNKNDIVMAMTDMKDNVVILGVPAMIDRSNHYVLNQRVARIYLPDNSKLINPYLLYIQLNDSEFIATLQSKANSGVQVNLSTETIKDCDILIPLMELQKEKGSAIEEIYLKKENNLTQIQSLTKLRDSLLPKLMSGEVSVESEKLQVRN